MEDLRFTPSEAEDPESSYWSSVPKVPEGARLSNDKVSWCCWRDLAEVPSITASAGVPSSDVATCVPVRVGAAAALLRGTRSRSRQNESSE
jgi:hypothetical protein